MSKVQPETRKARRDDLLREMKSGRHKHLGVPAEPTLPGQLGWEEMGLLAEGLAFANRPLKRGTEDVTGHYDLGPRGAWILNLISSGVVHPTDVSMMFAVGRSLITAELVRLTEAGLIVAKPGEQDRRRSQLALTEEGEAAARRVRERISAIVQHNLRQYSPDEIRLFARMLRDVRGESDGQSEKEQGE